MRCNAIALVAASVAIAGCSGHNTSVFQGYVEGEYVYLASPIGGRLERLLARRGETVTQGAPLAELETQQEAAANQQAAAQQRASEARLADLRLGKRKPELEVASAQLVEARAQEEQAAQQLKRDEAQFAAGGIARGQLDDSRANHAVKAARLKELAGQLDVARLPARADEIRAQDAQVAASRAALSASAWRLDQMRIAAPSAGLVADTFYREGEWVPAGSPVVRMLPPINVKVRFFVPETEAGALRTGRGVVIRCDGCAAEVQARVDFISDSPEYTPPVIYSNDTRAKLVFMAEARPSGEHLQQLRPGQPVTVTLE